MSLGLKLKKKVGIKFVHCRMYVLYSTILVQFFPSVLSAILNDF